MIRVKAKLKDGTPVIISFEDKGDTISCFDAIGNRYEAVTTWMEIETVPHSLGERFVQIPKSILNEADNPKRLRRDAEIEGLEAMGIDIASLDLPPLTAA